MSSIHKVIVFILAINFLAACNKSEKATPQKSIVGTWQLHYSIDSTYHNSQLISVFRNDTTAEYLDTRFIFSNNTMTTFFGDGNPTNGTYSYTFNGSQIDVLGFGFVEAKLNSPDSLKIVHFVVEQMWNDTDTTIKYSDWHFYRK